MILRAYREEDADIIAGWIRSEEDLYKWSADRFGKYPLTGKDIQEKYASRTETGRFFPFTALDEADAAAGHFIIRYPQDDGDGTVRFGFVIVDPALRGRGCGQEMLRLGIAYVKEHLAASRITLGVFDNNPPARRCYEALGFTEFDRHACPLPAGVWDCAEMELFV